MGRLTSQLVLRIGDALNKLYTENKVVVQDYCENLLHNHEPCTRAKIVRQIVINSCKRKAVDDSIVTNQKISF